MFWLRLTTFLLLVPGSVMIWGPMALLRFLGKGEMGYGAVGWIGVIPLVLGFVLFVWTVLNFAKSGKGTPAPYDPPKSLVIEGPYRWVRNPMYVGVVGVLIGEAMLVDSTVLTIHTGATALSCAIFVLLYEEPKLSRLFGEQYAEYRRTVPRWLPRPPQAV